MELIKTFSKVKAYLSNCHYEENKSIFPIMDSKESLSSDCHRTIDI